MKINLNPKSRLVAATNILARIGVNLEVKSVSRDIARNRVKELEVVDAQSAQAILEVLSSLEGFDDVVREQVREMRTAERYEVVRKNFKTILDDADRMVKQVADDGKVTFVNRLQNRLMEWRRGTIQSRFQELRNVSEQVFADVNDQIQREVTILDAYKEFRGALKESTLVAQILLEKTTARKDEFAEKLVTAQKSIDDAKAQGMDFMRVGVLELNRDKAQSDFEVEDRRYQSAIDISEQLNIAFGIAEAVMQKLSQTTEIKEAQQRKTATFYTANNGTLTALMTAFTSMKGLHEATQMQNSMADGIRDALEKISETGTQVQQNALKATYGTTVDAKSLQKLFTSAVEFEEMQRKMIDELRATSRTNDEAVRKTIEEGQKRLADAVSGRARRERAGGGVTIESVEINTGIEGVEYDLAVPSVQQTAKTMRAETQEVASTPAKSRGPM